MSGPERHRASVSSRAGVGLAGIGKSVTEYPERQRLAMLRPTLPVARVFVLSLLLALLVGSGGPLRAASDLSIFDDSLAAGWSNWSWDTTVSVVTTTAHGGTSSLSVTYTAAWAGLYLHADPAIATATYTSLQFWIRGSAAGQRLRVVANGNNSQTVAVTAQAGSWTEFTVPLSSLGSPSPLSDVYWQDTTGAAQSTFYLDDIILVGSTGPPPSSPTLHIDVGAARHAISEDIYGMNFADEQTAAALRLPVRRRGGNSTSRYNWQNDTYNTGSDWYFENIPDDSADPSKLPDGSAADLFVEQDRRTGTRSLLTAPLIGWVAKRRLATHPYDCGFAVSKYGAQHSTDPWDPNCGSGTRNGGTAITGNDPTDTSVAIVPTFLAGWVAHLTAKYGAASAGGVAFWDLDNEPMLWNSTHRDVHPSPVSYDELRDQTYAYAAAIKAADGSAMTLGPVLWGWCAYLYSALDGCSAGTDYQTHGNTYFVPWYLQQMAAYETQHGVRVLDYLDLHYYPQASGVALSSAGSAATQALRLRSTRSLWDPSYVDESWVSDTQAGGVAVRLIPRMKDWVTAAYPGTKTAISEYNWGALDDINGALAQTDVLGIFGREGLDLATLWGPPTLDQPGAFAFRIFRNYDGAGNGFGGVSVAATSSDQDVLSVYAAERASDGVVTIVVINKGADSQTSAVSLAGFLPAASAAVYRYDATNLSAIVRQADQAVTAAGFSATFPANSVTLLVLTPAQGAVVTVSAGVAGSGAGAVSSGQAGIDCGSTCSALLPSGTTVTVSAVPGAGAVFKEWRGACAGSGATCTVSPTGATTVTAVFSQVFTDDPLVARSTVPKVVHLTELRHAIDTLRTRLSLAAVSWTDSTLVAGRTVVKAQHLTELRTALAEAYLAAGRGTLTFAETVAPAQTPIKASHIAELRAAIRALE